jgi:hypothetical protein
MAKQIELFIAPNGDTRHIYSEDAAAITRRLGGVVTTRRASHVEPTEELRPEVKQHLESRGHQCIPGMWWADMVCVPEITVLGPFATRDEALVAETKWLSDNHIPQRA